MSAASRPLKQRRGLEPALLQGALGDPDVTAAMVVAASSEGTAIVADVPPDLPESDRQAVAAFRVFLGQSGHPSDSSPPPPTAE